MPISICMMSRSPFRPLAIPDISNACSVASPCIPETNSVHPEDGDHDALVTALAHRTAETVDLRNQDKEQASAQVKELEKFERTQPEVISDRKPEYEVTPQTVKVKVEAEAEPKEKARTEEEETLEEPKGSSESVRKEELELELQESRGDDGEDDEKAVKPSDFEDSEAIRPKAERVSGLEPPIVVHNSSSWVMAGFASDDFPTAFVSTSGDSSPQYLYQYPMKYVNPGFRNRRPAILEGLIANWERMEEIWRSVFYSDLSIDPKEHPILLTEIPLNPKANRERMTEIMFEEFKVPAMYVVQGAALALFASARTTGTVLQIGDSVALTISIYEGYCLPHSCLRPSMAGGDLTDYLAKILRERGYSFESATELDCVRDIKETLCYVAYDFDAEMLKAEKSSDLNASYELPDGRGMKLENEQFRCPEALFQPSAAKGDGALSIQHALFQTIEKCDVDIRKELYGSLVLTGGTTMFKGLAERLEKEVDNLAPPSREVKLLAPPERKYSMWIGGAMIASLESFADSWIMKEDYELSGPSIVHRMCF